MAHPSFIHLKLHSEFSLIDGMVRLKPLMTLAKDCAMPALALTDMSNLFAAVKFQKAAFAAGIKPIFGAELYVANNDDARRPFHVTALCQDDEGYHHLRLLISEAYLHGQVQGKPLVTFELLAKHSAGLLVLSGAQKGDVGHALLQNNVSLLKARVAFWQENFPNRYYLELSRVGREDEKDYHDKAIALALSDGLPVVATNDVCFLRQEDFEAHEARVCIHDGYILADPKRPRNHTEQQYFKSPEEMQVVFADVPQALENSVEIAKRCNVSLKLGDTFLPNFPVPEGMSMAQFLRHEAKNGLIVRLAKSPLEITPELEKEYYARLDLELDVINEMGFPGYFLIVADFIRWAKQNDIPVGPGRGSGAGSLVAYVLEITDLDPLHYELLFERFLNPERVSMPDFDIDFCMDGRDRVIEYVAKKYGKESVSQIITFGTMAARAVVRDVGRVLGFGYGHIDKIAKLIPFEIGMTLEKALQMEELLRERYEQEDDTRQLIDLARKLEGVARNAGRHAGGVVIAPTKLSDFSAIYCEAGSQQQVSQFDKDDVESVGLVKFDFLGLRTLTIIKWALDTINARKKQEGDALIDITQIPMDDEKTFVLLKDCQSQAVFQLESRGMRDLIKRLQPDCFEEIVALVALFRPGPLQSGMVDDFIDRKHGRSDVEYPHPDLEPILKPTYGVILYQEQVMQIAQVLAGYTLGGADILRRAMGKKKAEEMAEQRAIFSKGAIEKGVAARLANSIFDLMEKFAGYGFNRSHSAAYALISYQTAWLKAHYPQAFMSAVLSSDMDNTDKVVAMVDECRAMKLKMILPDVNVCQYAFTLNEENDLVYGLGAIKGVGQAAVEDIVMQREHDGPYENLFSFCQRVDLHKVNRRVLEALIKAGAMDSFGVHRASLQASVNNAMSFSEQTKRNKENKQADLFGNNVDEQASAHECVAIQSWNEQLRLQNEKDVLGWYASGHPIRQYEKELAFITTSKIKDLQPKDNQVVVVAGFVLTLRAMMTKRGDRMAFITLDDGDGRIELAVFSDLYTDYRELLVKDKLIIVEGDVSVDEYSGGYRMSAKRVFDMEEAREIYAKGILLALHAKQLSSELISQLEQVLLPHCNGTCPITIEYLTDNNKAKLNMGKKWSVTPKDALINQLRLLFGESAVKVGY